MLQKLDINSWLWSFPASNVQSSSRASGYTLVTINNTIYTYGGLSADVNGLPMTNALQNTLSMMDANTYQWTTGANGLGLADHTTCYMKICDCLITFGGTPTGNPTEVTDAINVYDLGKKVWNVQGIQMAAGASTPSARRLHTANCLDDYMVIYGGGTNQPADTDVWILNATAYPTMTWQKMTIANQSESPSLRMGHSSVLDETNKKIYMFGGWGVSATNDSNMYVLDVNKWSWTRVPVTGYPIDAIPSLNGTTSTNTNTNTQNTQLSSGAIAGIAVGSIAGALLLIAAAVIYMRRRKRRQGEESEKSNDTMMIGENLSESLHHNKENPFYYNSGGYYNTNDDDDDNNNEHGYYYAGNDNGRKRISKAWVGLHPSNTQQSLTTTRRSEIGDYSDRVVTGVLEALETNDGSVAARSGNSNRGSKILLVPNNHDTTIIGQVPNEIIAQKPNEFSIPAARHQHIHTTIQNEEIPDVPPSCSDVLKMNGGSSIAATSTQTWDTTKDTQQKRLVQHHLHQQQYPSSTLNMPIAETVTPPTTTTPNSSNIQAGFDIYNAVSPLDVLASLGQQQPQQQQGDDGQQQESQSNSRNASFTIVKSIRDSINPSDKYFQHLRPLISILPHRYKVDKSKIPIVGPSNSIVFAFKKDQQTVAIKSFGRREAWERECRTLVKLKSPCVVEILEVLTIQGDNSSSNNIQYVTVMERLDETLNAFIHKQSYSAQQSDRNCIARDILKCLSWCHSKGIAFCDLKPSNIMHQHGGRWKLIDFEASRTINEECVGVITPRYCSPEVARATTYGLEGANGVVATASVDLWSLGCVIYVSVLWK
ncbi:MAG: hypothetical protein EXX96DRAFT_491214 [Benjaminiella poitrasii]|nr:MAG: hypothetical protein EXX96DRAFT_491214 [Benjaminiella poitrasii]